MKNLRIRVPASSANLGPGFDTLAVAVNLYNLFDLQLGGSEIQLEIVKGLDPALQPICLEMIRQAGDHFFSRTGILKQPFLLRIENSVPIARGLASSATMRLAVVAGLNAALESGLSDCKLIHLASELEACSDNAAASYLGGIVASGIVNGKLVSYKIAVPEPLDFVAVFPTEWVETDKARSFPATIPRADAVSNLNHSVLLALAFQAEDYEQIGDLLEDRLHQPYRQAAIPALKPLFDVIHAAKSAGALGAYLSGSGSTIMAITLHHREHIAKAMQDVFSVYGMKTEVRFLKADAQGVQIHSGE